MNVPAPAPPPRVAGTGDFVRDLFDTIVANKALPKYQFERRVDAILSLFLPDVLRLTYGWDVDVVAPEFPLKRTDNNQTTNVDYALFRRSTPDHAAAWILLELKTDNESFRDTQLSTYRDASIRGMCELRRDLTDVANATKHTMKYRRLLDRIDAYPHDPPIELLFITPSSSASRLRSTGVRALSFGELGKLNVPRYEDAWKLFCTTVLPALA